MQASQKILVAALIFGAVIAGGVLYLFPGAPWWLLAIIGVLCAGVAYDQWLKMSANEKIIDRGDWPNKDGR